MKRILVAALCAGALTFSGCARKTVDAAQATPDPQPITIPQGTIVRVRLDQAVDTRRNRAGDTFTATLDEPLVSGDRVVVPQGTEFAGHVVASRDSGRFKGRAVLSLKLDSFTLNGETYDVMSNDASRVSGGHKKRNWLWFGGGSGGGALIGAAAGPEGALIGAGAGGAAGFVGAAITGKKHIYLPVETEVRFSLQSPVEVDEPASN